MEVKNPFEVKSEATRYENYRPKYHHIPFEQIGKIVGKTFSSSLDVACGTGHSTIALSKFSEKIVGCDLSETMLSEARKYKGIEFVQANANNLPFDNCSFDFVNISMGFHWVDQEKFISEVKRVLLPQGYFNVDSYGFMGKISVDPEKQQLHFDLFETHLPPASRKRGYPAEDMVNSFGFELVKEIKYDHKVSLNADEFTNLIMTWSNFQILEPAQQKITAQKMREVYVRIFEDGTLPLDFGGKAMLYRANIRIINGVSVGTPYD